MPVMREAFQILNPQSIDEEKIFNLQTGLG